MKRNRFTVEQIIRMLREAEVHSSYGESVKQVSRELGITDQDLLPLEERIWRYKDIAGSAFEGA